MQLLSSHARPRARAQGYKARVLWMERRMIDRVASTSFSSRKGKYSTPTLTVYGTVSALTASGTGTQVESVQGASCQLNANRNRC